MERVIYIRQGKNLPYPPYMTGYPNCPGDGKNPCIEISVIQEHKQYCEACDKRIDCLAKSVLPCRQITTWHICSGGGAGVYYSPDYSGRSFPGARRPMERVKGIAINHERKFKEITGLTFEDVVFKLYRV